MKLICHQIYELNKGLRDLALYTADIKELSEIETKLQGRNLDYEVQMLGEAKFNVFFGEKRCVDVIRSFAGKPLNKYSNEQDYILGIMLGYSRLKQCDRYLERISANKDCGLDTATNIVRFG